MNREQFKRLKLWWKQDTGYLSSIMDKALHPAYQQIIREGGEDAIPYIIDDLKEEPDHWFYALSSITGKTDVVPEKHYGKMDKMAQDWIEWYEEQQ